MLTPPPLNGLVLAGGISSRLGRDKGLLRWHGRPQRLYLLELFHSMNMPAFISIRPDQMAGPIPHVQVIEDRFGPIGPAGALLSAMSAYPDCGWLVVACDLPLVDADVLSFLSKNRDPECLFTGFRGSFGPEPLAAIWEPTAQNVLFSMLQKGEYSLKQTLKFGPIKLLDVPWPEKLLNINTSEEMEALCRLLDIRSDNL